MALLSAEAKIIIGSAMLKCIETNQYDFANLLIDYGFDFYEKSEKAVYCANYNLQKLKRDSKFARIYDRKPEFESKCQYYPIISIYPFTSIIHRYEDSVGELKDTACGIISKELVQIFSFEVLLVAIEKDKELKRIEIKEIFALINDKLPRFADCIIQRLKINKF